MSGSGDALSIEQRLARLEDVEAIKALRAKYARLCDSNYDADELSILFTEDALWESSRFGTLVGREKIREFFRNISGDIVWAFHLLLSPVINVAADGGTASGSWYILTFSTMVRPDDPRSRDAVITMGRSEDAFVKQDGEWRIERLKVTIHHISNLDQGWVKQPFRS